MRAGLVPIFLIVALFGCHSKTKATADLLASLDTELSQTEVEVQKCLRALDERSEILARKLSLLHDTHQRTMFRNYANVVPLVRAEGHARKSLNAFFNQRRRCQELEGHGISLRERLVATITLNVGSVPQAWLARSAWFENDLVAAKSRSSDLTDKVTKLLGQADSEFDQVKVLRGRGCVVLGNCDAIRQADVLVAAEGETGAVAPLSARGP
jgi:predicted HAD superfamily phosphohydrolase